MCGRIIPQVVRSCADAHSAHKKCKNRNNNPKEQRADYRHAFYDECSNSDRESRCASTALLMSITTAFSSIELTLKRVHLSLLRKIMSNFTQ